MTTTPAPNPIWVIDNIESWYNGIRVSNDPILSAVITTFELRTNLVFDERNKVYLEDGSRDIHYFRLGSNQSFLGNKNTIEVRRGGFGARNMGTGVFRMKGSPAFPALLTDLNIIGEQIVLLDGNALVCSSFGEIAPEYLRFRNLYVQFQGYLGGEQAIIMNHNGKPPASVWFENVELNLRDIIPMQGKKWCGFMRETEGNVHFDYCRVISKDVLTPTEVDFYLFVGKCTKNIVYMEKCFSQIPSQAGLVSFIGMIDKGGEAEIKDSYAITGSADRFYNGLFFIVNYNGREGSVEIKNYYSNHARPDTIQGVILYNYGMVSLNNIKNRFWFFKKEPTKSHSGVSSTPPPVMPPFLPSSTTPPPSPNNDDEKKKEKTFLEHKEYNILLWFFIALFIATAVFSLCYWYFVVRKLSIQTANSSSFSSSRLFEKKIVPQKP